MKIVFIGSSQFGLRCLQLTHELPALRVVGVVTAPPVFSISYRPGSVRNVLHADIADYAHKHDLPCRVLQERMNEPGLLKSVQSWQPDMFLVVGWYHLLPKSWRRIAPAYGLHASLLPDYSGGAPLVWAMINGEKKTGITLFQMDSGVDAGPIAAQMEEYIYPDDTISTLYTRIEERGLDILRQALPKMVSKTLCLTPQDNTKRRVMPQRSPEDGRIDWDWDVFALDRFIRAQTQPYPGAFSLLRGEKFTIWCAKPAQTSVNSSCPGQIRKNTTSYTVDCADGHLELQDVTYCGRKYNISTLCQLLGSGGQQLGV